MLYLSIKSLRNLVFDYKVLSSYISPNPQRSGDPLTSIKEGSGDVSTEHLQSIFPDVFRELLSNSCLIPAISSYLRNDSGETRLMKPLLVNTGVPNLNKKTEVIYTQGLASQSQVYCKKYIFHLAISAVPTSRVRYSPEHNPSILIEMM